VGKPAQKETLRPLKVGFRLLGEEDLKDDG
jgi:hypothetical protein